jgi:taurine--2-oxoglutarate transaminase
MAVPEVVETDAYCGCRGLLDDRRRYLDFSSQLMCVNLGHKNPAVVEAIAQQARELAYVAPGYATRARAHLSEKLLEVLPAGLNKFFFTPSGTEGNEAAFKIARMYTGKTKIISRYRSYHGSTAGSIAATGDPRRWAMEPGGKANGFVFAPETNCYNCPIKHTYPSCGIACVDYIEHMIRNESDVAAIILEPVVGTNGVLVPPPEYFPRLRAICDKYGVLMIADEVMAGWGRTGKWFAVDHWDVKPDMLVTAKGITSAYVPLGLCATTTKIADYFQDHYFSHGHTYEAHPITLGPAAVTIEEMQRLKLVERAAELEPYVRQKLEALKAKHPSVGDVRGLGLFFAVEIVKNRETKELFNTMNDKVEGKPLVVDQIAAKMMAQGVSIQAWVSHFVIAPPLIVTKEELDLGIAALDEHLGIADALVEA